MRPPGLLYNIWGGQRARRRERGTTGVMSDRGILFLFSILMILAGIGAAGWLVVSGQADTVDGLFLVLTSLLVAAVFALYVMFMIRRAMEAAKPAPKTAAQPGAKEAAAKPSPATVTQS